MNAIDRKIEEFRELHTPINEKEFLQMIQLELPEMTASNLEEHVKEQFRKARKKGVQVTKWDVYETIVKQEKERLFKQGSDWREVTSTENMRERGEPYILPKMVSLTPLPDVDEYDPAEYYNMAQDLSIPIRPNLQKEEDWYDLPKVQRHMPEKQEKGLDEMNKKETLEHSIRVRDRAAVRSSTRNFYKNWEIPQKDVKRFVDPNRKEVSPEEWDRLDRLMNGE